MTQPVSARLNGRYPPGFEEDDRLRSDFVRELTLAQLNASWGASGSECPTGTESIPRTLVRFWHDPRDVPADVRQCLESWDELSDEGFAFKMFCDASATAYIARLYGPREVAAFARCRHPAMRSDYLRLCFVLAEGGLYVDADDVLLNGGWEDLFGDSTLKIQPLGFDVTTNAMVPAADLKRTDLPSDGRIFYVNNNPIAAPAGHPVLRRALARATDRLLGGEPSPEIQSTTGPGNLTAALAAHVRESQERVASAPPDFELLFEWERVAKPRWNLGYRNDGRNWRNMDGQRR